MSDEAASVEDTSDPNLQARSYTGVFKIERRIRKINDFNVPMRGGLVPAQAGTFVGVLLVMVILWFVLLSPLLSFIFQQSPPGVIAASVILAPPVILSRKIGKPMPYGKTIPGWVRSRTRRYLDDEWHRGGTPVPKREKREEKVLHITRSWRPDGEGAEHVADVVRDADLYSRPRTGFDVSPGDELLTRRMKEGEVSVDLLEWVEQVELADAEDARRAEEKARNRQSGGSVNDHATFGQVHSA